MLNRVLTHLAPWAVRLGLVAWMMSVDDPFRLSVAVLALSAQIPLQRSLLAWGFRPARA